MIYLTPRKLRSMGLGTSFPEDDTVLTEAIRIASGLVNRHCAAPLGHSFKGGSVLNEQHEWRIGNVHIPGSRKVFPVHRPVISVADMRIRQSSGASGWIAIGSDYLYINNADGYVEVVSMVTSIATAHVAYLPNMGLEHPVAEIDYDYGYAITAIDEELLASASGDVYAGEGQFWTDDPVTVKVGGVPVTSGFEIDRYEGTVDFATTPAGEVTASYTTRLHPDVARATALIAADYQAQTRLNATGMQGLSGLRVLEVELRQSRTTGFTNAPINPAAATMLEPFRFRSIF